MRIPRLTLVAALAVGTAATIALIAGNSSSTPTAPRPAKQAPAGDTSHRQPELIRTLAVTSRAEPAPSAHPDHMRALLLDGRLPPGVVKATVLTDENCAPDANGVSHCRNELRLPGGETIVVRHPHRMDQVPCMVPGETVRVGRATGV